MKFNKIFYFILITLLFILAIKKTINLAHFQFNQSESLIYNLGDITGQAIGTIVCLGLIYLFYNKFKTYIY